MLDSSVIQRRILVAGILLLPILSLADVVSIFLGQYAGPKSVATSPFVKGLKDVLFVSLILTGIIGFARGRPIVRDVATVTLVVLLLFAAAWSTINNSPLLAAAGIRAYLPIFALIFLVCRPNAELFGRVSRLLEIMFLLHLMLQIGQLLFAPPIYGTNVLGLAARNPGMFIIPATAGLFSCLCFYMLFNFHSRSKRSKLLLYVLIPLSVFLTGSGSAFALLLAMMAYGAIYFWKHRWTIVPAAGIAFAVLVIFLDSILGRSDVLSVSASTRLSIFLETLGVDTLFFSPYFGAATNTGVLLTDIAEGAESAFIADSLYASFVGNAGLLAMVLFFYILLRRWSLKPEYMMFVMIVAIGGASTNLTELFPVSLLLPFVIRYFDYQRIETSMSESTPIVPKVAPT